MSHCNRSEPYTIIGRCLNDVDHVPLAGITVRLYRAEGRISSPAEFATTVTDTDGRYSFAVPEPPRPYDEVDRLSYEVFGFANNRPIGNSFRHYHEGEEVVEIRMTERSSTLSGRVINSTGQPVSGAIMLKHAVNGRFKLRAAPGDNFLYFINCRASHQAVLVSTLAYSSI